jgi:hypothetical protein
MDSTPAVNGILGLVRRTCKSFGNDRNGCIRLLCHGTFVGWLLRTCEDILVSSYELSNFTFLSILSLLHVLDYLLVEVSRTVSHGGRKGVLDWLVLALQIVRLAGPFPEMSLPDDQRAMTIWAATSILLGFQFFPRGQI